MKRAISETERRRRLQERYNKEHKITPEGIKKSLDDLLSSIYEADYYEVPAVEEPEISYTNKEELEREIINLTKQMKAAANALEFERAAQLRDRIKALKEIALRNY